MFPLWKELATCARFLQAELGALGMVWSLGGSCTFMCILEKSRCQHGYQGNVVTRATWLPRELSHDIPTNMPATTRLTSVNYKVLLQSVSLGP